MDVTSEHALIGLTALVIGGMLLWRARPKARPPTQTFACGKCRKPTRHGPRTEQAWRDGRTRFYCGACHARWLAENGLKDDPPERSGRRQASGCLGMVAWAGLLPLAGALRWWLG